MNSINDRSLIVLIKDIKQKTNCISAYVLICVLSEAPLENYEISKEYFDQLKDQGSIVIAKTGVTTNDVKKRALNIVSAILHGRQNVSVYVDFVNDKMKNTELYATHFIIGVSQQRGNRKMDEQILEKKLQSRILAYLDIDCINTAINKKKSAKRIRQKII